MATAMNELPQQIYPFEAMPPFFLSFIIIHQLHHTTVPSVPSVPFITTIHLGSKTVFCHPSFFHDHPFSHPFHSNKPDYTLTLNRRHGAKEGEGTHPTAER
jgi:hypothetical protein